ncbi:MAG: hypothetical protein HY536_01720 [Candidatus Colwellbacteria bacterium]|nr:hypothetical protein [Candidatus Colwellbacteria bacterium]
MLNRLLAFFNRIVMPHARAGGLFVSDTALRYVRVTNGRIARASLRLPSHVVVGGAVGHREHALRALRALRSMVEPDPRKKTRVVLSLSGRVVYSQVFRVALPKGKRLDEALELNARMISPIEASAAYWGYERIGESENSEAEFLAGFIEKRVLDKWIGVLREAGWSVVAAEGASTCLVRALKAYERLDPAKAHLILSLAPEGFHFVILRRGSVYFDYFYPWETVFRGGEEMTLEALRQSLTDELDRVMAFYSARYSEDIEALYLITPRLREEIGALIAERFPLLSVKTPAFPESWISPGWTETLGAALRGMLSLSEDSGIRLGSAAIFEEALYTYATSFIGMWRTAFVALLAFLIVLSAGGIAFLGRVRESVSEEGLQLASKDRDDLKALTLEAREFNARVAETKIARSRERDIALIFTRLAEHATVAGGTAGVPRAPVAPAPGRIELTRVFLRNGAEDGMVAGIALSPDAALAYKDELARQGVFAALDLPLSSLEKIPDGRVSFSIAFKARR